MRSIFAPRLVNGPFGDPGLYVDFRDERRAVLFDLGDISVLAPRLLLRLSHVFVSHAHMDHFSGFDQLLRVVLGRKQSITMFGGPGFVRQVEHKLLAYVWNVIHRYENPLTLTVHEIEPSGAGRVATFCSKDRLGERGLATGPWLRTLKEAVREGKSVETPIVAEWRDRGGLHHVTRTLGEMKDGLFEIVGGERIGYVTDLRYTQPNVEALKGLLYGCDVLFIESVFLHEHADHALRKHHLTAQQAGLIARALEARLVVPFHFSPRYADRAHALAAEMEAGRRGASPADGAGGSLEGSA
jgi:ribonuclease Z